MSVDLPRRSDATRWPVEVDLASVRFQEEVQSNLIWRERRLANRRVPDLRAPAPIMRRVLSR